MNSKRTQVLKIPFYRTWLASRFFSNLAKQMMALVVAWQVYDITKSPLALGFIGLVEALPFVMMGLWAGHTADRYEKKYQIAGAVGGHVFCAATLFLLSLFSDPSVIPIYIVLGSAGILSSFEFISSNAYVQTLISKEDFPVASGWNLTQYQTTVIAGPLMSGAILSMTSPKVVYGVVTALFFCSAFFSWRLKKLGVIESPAREDGWTSIKAGVRFLLGQRLIVACMVLDMFAVFFGDVIAILPVFAAMFQVGPFGLGVLRAAPPVGSIILSLLQANRSLVTITWRNFLITVAIFGLCMIGFGLSKSFFLSVFFLFASGFADGISVIIRQSIYQANTPDQYRGRVASVSSIFIRLSNEMGAFESGLAAHLLGTVPSVIFGGVMTLASVVFMRGKFGNLDKSEANSLPSR